MSGSQIMSALTRWLRRVTPAVFISGNLIPVESGVADWNQQQGAYQLPITGQMFIENMYNPSVSHAGLGP